MHSKQVAAVVAIAAFLLSNLPGETTGYSLGAPDTTCDDLIPAHGPPSQTTPPPYTITPSAVEVEGGKQMLVTLEAKEGAMFRGFLVQGKSSETGDVVGTFFTTDYKYLNCNNGMNNAVTHQGPADKDKVTLTWEPPSDFAGDVVFTGTFVQTKNVFWVGVTSEKVTVRREVPASPAIPTSTSTTTTTTTSSTPPSVSPASELGGEVNAGDVVISVVDAPSGVLVENDTSVVTPEGGSPPSPTTPSSPSSPSTPVPSPTEVSTVSSDPSVANEGEETQVEEEEEPLPAEVSSPRPKPNKPRRKFGILGRRRTTSTTTAAPTTAKTTTTPKPLLEEQEELLPETAGLERDLVNVYDECGNTKGCFGFPAECEASKKCTMLVTYSKVPSGYKFEIMSNTVSGYVAAGLSDDDKMGDDSVMACMASNSGADVVMGFNNGRNNELLVESKYGLSEIQAAVVDGKTYCTFVRDPSTEISGIVFDLDNDRFHLMLATGSANPNGLSYHDKRTVSSGTVSLDSFEAVESRSELFRTLHACFMIGAWICAASCGIMVARYFKKTWLKNRACGIDQWFHLHRFFMGLTWSLTVAGIVLIVYYLNGWTELDPRVNPHAILGVVSTALCFIQPFMALCRCSPTSKRRPVFNWLHWFVGNSAQILGIAAIYFGFELIGAPKWIMFVLIIFIAFHCLVHLLLSIGQCITDSRGESSSNVYPMKELNGSRSPLQPTEKNTDAPGAAFRKVMLFFYFLGNFAITAVLLLVVTVDIETLRSWGLIFWEK